MKNYCPSTMPLDTRIAGHKTVGDWLELRTALINDPDDVEKWKEAYDFFRLRIDTRFIKPIESILAINQNLGEGYSASALQCVLLEFIEALRKGEVYRTPISQDALPRKALDLGISVEELESHKQPHEYNSSRSLFVSFLTTQAPFSNVFINKSVAGTFYDDIRCGLLHEAATKSGSKIRAEKDGDPLCLMEPTTNGIIVYRTPFQRALLDWIEDLQSSIQSNLFLQQNFLRKMDDIAQVKHCFYFAYGSNMKSSLLRSRVEHIHSNSTRRAHLKGYGFKYDKKADDGTAKANISKSDEVVWGVCYEIDHCSFIRLLQDHEKGYDSTDVWIYDDNSVAIIAKTCISRILTNSEPLEEYVDIVVEGAREHDLPEDYIKEYIEMT